MRNTIIRNLKDRFHSYNDLMEFVDDSTISKGLDVPKHKTLGEHLWCLVGARESYTTALREGRWCGFSCSMTAFSKTDFATALRDSADNGIAVIEGVARWTAERDDLLARLSEHEVIHEGQIIRHIYGIGAELPPSWQWA